MWADMIKAMKSSLFKSLLANGDYSVASANVANTIHVSIQLLFSNYTNTDIHVHMTYFVNGEKKMNEIYIQGDSDETVRLKVDLGNLIGVSCDKNIDFFTHMTDCCIRGANVGNLIDTVYFHALSAYVLRSGTICIMTTE